MNPINDSLGKFNEYERKAKSEDDDYMNELEHAKNAVRNAIDALEGNDELEDAFNSFVACMAKIRTLKQKRVDLVLSRSEPEYEPEE